MVDYPSFVFVTCQVGAEPALKHEVAREWPGLRFAFSRPGFLTFKIAPGKEFPDDFGSKLVFARASGFCLGKATGATPEERADQVCRLIGDRPVTQLHVWPRDRHTPGFRDYEPGMTPEAADAERVICEQAPLVIGKQLARNNCQTSETAPANGSRQTASPDPPCPPLRRGREVARPLAADVIIVGDAEWWVGYHLVHSLTSWWPGGFCQETLPAGAVSRAYLKMHEALLWSGFHTRPGERCVEIGSAPGGASQYLLAQGLAVTGIDPAEMDPVVLADRHFRHIRKRSKEVPRSEFTGVDWLTCDVNLPPNYTLDAVKAIVSHPGVRFKGMLLTLKLVEWSLAEEIPKYLDRIRAWGFRHIRARQLHHNRQEICVAASGFRPARESPRDRTGPNIRRRRIPRPHGDGVSDRNRLQEPHRIKSFTADDAEVVAAHETISYNRGSMAAGFTDAELLAYLDEALPVERMAEVENALRSSGDLRNRTVELRMRRDEQGHSVGEIWRRGRLSCPTRHQLGSYVLGALPADLAQYLRFHLETVGCRYCAANLDDLRQSAGQGAAETAQRRQKFFQSSAGYVRKLGPER